MRYVQAIYRQVERPWNNSSARSIFPPNILLLRKSWSSSFSISSTGAKGAGRFCIKVHGGLGSWLNLVPCTAIVATRTRTLITTTITMSLPSVSIGRVREQNVHSGFLLMRFFVARPIEWSAVRIAAEWTPHCSSGKQSLQVCELSWPLVFRWCSIVHRIMRSKAWMVRLPFERSWQL